jgi:ABC-type glycerol-3-phosphate transport system substrate-binding protein
MMYKKKMLFCVVLTALAAAAFAAGGRQDAGGPADSKASGAFNWKRYEGQTITVYMVEHSTSAAVQQKLRDFEAQTGIKVNIR